jgi:xylose isomerase
MILFKEIPSIRSEASSISNEFHCRYYQKNLLVLTDRMEDRIQSEAAFD